MWKEWLLQDIFMYFYYTFNILFRIAKKKRMDTHRRLLDNRREYLLFYGWIVSSDDVSEKK